MKANKRVLIPAVIAVITVIVLVAVFASSAETPTDDPDVIAAFIERWNTLAEDSLADFDLHIAVDSLRLVADGAQATTYEFRFWDGATTGEYHKVSLSLAKEGNPHWKAGTVRVSVESNRSPHTERLIASWGLLIAAMLPGGTLADAGDVLRELEVLESDVDLGNLWRQTTRSGYVFGFEGFQSFFLMYGYEL